MSSRPRDWPPRDWRALIALAASIAGAAVLTGYSLWVVHIIASLPRDPATMPLIIAALANSNYGLLLIIGAVLLSLGLAINRRTFKANIGASGFEASGGEETAVAVQVVNSADRPVPVETADEGR